MERQRGLPRSSARKICRPAGAWAIDIPVADAMGYLLSPLTGLEQVSLGVSPGLEPRNRRVKTAAKI